MNNEEIQSTTSTLKEEKFINQIIAEIPLRDGEKLVISIGKGKEEKMYLNQRIFFKHKESGEYYAAEKRGYAIPLEFTRPLILALMEVEAKSDNAKN